MLNDPSRNPGAPIGLGNFRGPEILGRKVLPEFDVYSENILAIHNNKRVPVSMRFKVSKSGNCIAAYMITPVAHVKFKLDAEGNPTYIRLDGHPSAWNNGTEKQPLTVKADIKDGKAINLMKFTVGRDSLDGAWMPIDSYLDNRSMLEVPMIRSHLDIYNHVSTDSIADLKRFYR